MDTESIQVRATERVGNRERKPRCRGIEIDIYGYQNLLDHTDLTGEQRVEFLETMWAIIVAFIDLGFGVHPVQQSIENIEPRSDRLVNANDLIHDSA